MLTCPERVAIEYAFEQSPYHYRHMRLFNEARQERWQAQHRCGLGGSGEERTDLQQVGDTLKAMVGKGKIFKMLDCLMYNAVLSAAFVR